VADWLEQPDAVEPVDPFQGRELHGLQVAPRAAAADHLGLEQTDHALGQAVVVSRQLRLMRAVVRELSG
jgi:hypothetical protein